MKKSDAWKVGLFFGSVALLVIYFGFVHDDSTPDTFSPKVEEYFYSLGIDGYRPIETKLLHNNNVPVESEDAILNIQLHFGLSHKYKKLDHSGDSIEVMENLMSITTENLDRFMVRGFWNKDTLVYPE